ncbi:MAG: DUF5050 domain-containing protein [Roseivirga sp.]|nr:DUF5050 domain-containing protein [Roseivirga sp.]
MKFFLFILGLSLVLAGNSPTDITHLTEEAIYYASSAGTSGRDIYRISPDGGKPVRITHYKGRGHYPHHNSPKVSPDGTRLVYQNDTDGHDRYAIWVMNSDGSKQQRLTQKEGMYPNWSPDGKTIVFTGRRSGTWEILTVPANGGAEALLTQNHKSAQKPGWGATSTYSADGTQLFYSYVREKVLYQMNLKSGEVSALSSTNESVTHPIVSPDGKRIAANRKTGEGYKLVTMSTSGTDIKEVVSNVVSYSPPAWSPDGKALLFAGMVNGNQELFKVDMETGKETRLTSNNDFDALPTW